MFIRHAATEKVFPSQFPWLQYTWDTVLAILGTALVTLVLRLGQLYPLIPNISILYLLVVLILASTRGRYAAILASVLAAFSFDFFLIPPFYALTTYHLEEWIALVVFLFAAVLTGQLTVLLRQRVAQARRQEQEARTLYDLVRITTATDQLEAQLQAIAQSLVTVFASWGLRACALLLPDERQHLTVQAVAPQTHQQRSLTTDELATATQVFREGRSIGSHETALTRLAPSGEVSRIILNGLALRQGARMRFVPLKLGTRVLGVLLLRLSGGPLSFAEEAQWTEEQERGDLRTAFFWTFLDQAVSVIERARLRREALRIEVLQRTDALRSALLSSVSHDLRTPLASIKAAASSLQQQDVEWDESARRGFAATIEREADRLNRLVGNLLDMSRIEGGALKPEQEWYLPGDLVTDVVQRLHGLLAGRSVEVTLAADLPPLFFDYVQMDQVLTNLIENAVRYTAAGSPIEIQVQRTDQQVEVSVADRGPGIPEQDIERIFDKFYRVQLRQRGRQYPMGTGLGLAVCKGLVEANGGHIWARNRPGGGAIFAFGLPLGEERYAIKKSSDSVLSGS